MEQLRFPVAYMRGGTSKGLFFNEGVLPEDTAERDAIVLRAMGSPDPYGRQMDGVGGAISSASKLVIVSRSKRPDADVDYLFGQVAIDRPFIDYSGGCGNLTAAVGPFAIEEGLVEATGEETSVRIWQVNTQKVIVAHVKTRNGMPVADGDLEIHGIPFPGAPVVLDFIDPGPSACRAVLPTGRPVDDLDVPGLGRIRATLIDSGIPTVIIEAKAIGLEGTESKPRVDGDEELLARLELIRSTGGVAMGLGQTAEEVSEGRPHTPKIAFVTGPTDYVGSSGRTVKRDDVDVVARVISMGKQHHVVPVTAAIALGSAAAIPGTIVNQLDARTSSDTPLRLGHNAGTMTLDAVVSAADGNWRVEKASLHRTARRLMEGNVLVPASAISRLD